MLETIQFGGWNHCLRLSNGKIELVVTVEVGPRIVRLGFCGEQNLFGLFDEHLGRSKDPHWLCYGGHRLWHAPEDPERTYQPDNGPVEFEWDGSALILRTPVESATGMRKEIDIRLDPEIPIVRLRHRLVNESLWPVETAAWCLSVMARGGTAIVPQEPFRPHAEALLPARPMTLWHYTDMEDPRWSWKREWIELRQDPAADHPQKIGMQNRQGWAAYRLGDVLFIKHSPWVDQATYPDFGCNTELYTDAEILEIESLSPMQTLSPGGGFLEHEETWRLAKAETGLDADWVREELLPLIAHTPTSSQCGESA